MWRWGSLVQVARALRRRSAPLRMLWSIKKYLAEADAGEDHAGQAVKTKTETLKTFDQAVTSPFFWHYLEAWFSNTAGGLIMVLTVPAPGRSCSDS